MLAVSCAGTRQVSRCRSTPTRPPCANPRRNPTSAVSRVRFLDVLKHRTTTWRLFRHECCSEGDGFNRGGRSGGGNRPRIIGGTREPGHHSPLTTHHSPLTTHYSLLTTLSARMPCLRGLVSPRAGLGERPARARLGCLAGDAACPRQRRLRVRPIAIRFRRCTIDSGRSHRP